MKKLILFFIFISVSITFIQAGDKAVNLSTPSVTTSPWTKEVGLRYSMPILVRVYKDNVLFQPTGSLLGIFKDSKCWGYAGIGNSPVGPIFNVTIGYYLESETGFNYKLYDPTSGLIHNIIESVDFQDGVPVGEIQAPISLHVSPPSALNEVNDYQFSIYPNPIASGSDFKITLGSDAQKNTIIQLYTISGQLISVLYNGETINNQEIVINLDKKITKGIYIIKVINDKNIITQKIIIK